MNRLPLSKKVQIVECLVRGLGLKETSIVTDVSINTITKLQMDLGKVCLSYHEKTVKKLITTKHVRCRSVWSFADLRIPRAYDKDNEAAGDFLTWIAQDKESRLIISFSVGPSNLGSALALLKDVEHRLNTSYEVVTGDKEIYLDAAKEILSTENESHLHLSKLSKKAESLWYSLSLHFAYYNFCEGVCLPGTNAPAVRAGLKDIPLSVEDLVKLAG